MFAAREESRFQVRALRVARPVALMACLVMAIATTAASEISDGRRSACKGVDLRGRLHHLGQRSGTKAVVVCFLSTQCRVSNAYLPSLKRLASKYRTRGLEFYGVISDPDTTRREASKHRSTHHVSFPMLFDASGALRQLLRPTHTPYVLLLNKNCETLYEGAIDNWFIAQGRQRSRPTKHLLEDAIRAALAGNAVEITRTTAIGRHLNTPPDPSHLTGVTYARDIAPIIQAHCVSCHRRGQSGPFSLLSYRDVSKRARQIVEVTQSRFMPPWKPAADFGHFLDERRLTDYELLLLATWWQEGNPAGNPADLPLPVEHAEGWRLGEPDVILRMRHTFPIPPTGPDIRQYFVIPTQLAKSRLITAIDFQPGASQAIHHASFFLDVRRAARELDEADPEPGYRGFGGPRVQTQGTLRSWFPGMSPRHLPDGMGRLLPGGSDIIAEIHYVCSGKPERDRSQIGLYFAARSARQLVEEIQVANKDIKIPPGATRHLETATFTVPVDTLLLDVAPHMHVLGREMKVTATRPDDRVVPLVWVKDWDFNWQSQYSYVEPVRLPKGSRITVQAWYDNSSGNPLNPNSPPKTVTWGEDSTDEMLICHFQCTCDSWDDLKTLMSHYRKYFDSAQDTPPAASAQPPEAPPKRRRRGRFR